MTPYDLTDVEITHVLQRLHVADMVPPSSAALALRQTALAQWVDNSGENADDFLAAVAVARGGRASPADAARLWRHRQRVWADEMPVVIHRTGEGLAPIRLGDLYIEVELAREHRDRGEDGFGGARAALGEGARTLASALDVTTRERPRHGTRGVVLIGLPGSGKTTLLKNQLLADAEIPGRAPTLLLRFATLQRLLDAPLAAGSLRAWARLEAENVGCPDAADIALADPLGAYRFLLDGFDELQRPEQRREVLRWLAEDELPYWSNADFVITTRRAAWQEEDRGAVRHLLLSWTLLRLTSDAIRHYVRRWFPVVAEKETIGEPEAVRAERARDYAGRGEDLIREVIDAGDSEGSRVARLTGNPLLLSVVCLIFREERRMPRNRGELYRKCFEVLIPGRRRDGRHTGFTDAVGEALLGRLAWEMQAASVDLESPRELPLGDILEALDRARDCDGSVREVPPAEILRRLVEECALLVSADQRMYAFAHLTFQEYLAFRHGRGRAAALAEVAADPRWREVILLGMSDADFQAAFFGALLRRPGALAALPGDLLSACLAEKASAADLVAEPFVALFERAGAAEPWWARLARPFGLAPPRPPAEDLRVARAIFASAAPREVAAEIAKLWPAAIEVAAIGPQVLAEGARALALPNGPPLALVWVPAGSFWMGASNVPGSRNFDADADDHEAPVHAVRLDGYWMGQHPVTNAQYRAFVRATGAREPEAWRTEGFDADEQPVTMVDWAEARAFCAWLAGETGARAGLPTEARWERAARGDDPSRYPWGSEEPTQARAVFGGAALAPVGGRPEGASPFGVHDMAGNVWEWTASPFRPYVSGDDKPVDNVSDAAPRVVRGGSWGSPSGRLRAACRPAWHLGDRNDDLGFRVCVVRDSIS